MYFYGGSGILGFAGQNEGRIAILILLPLNVLWVVLLAAQGLLDDETANDRIAVLIIIRQTILSLFVIGIEWYFMSKKLVAYYKQNDRS
jgi:hypothetical protein